MIDYYFLSYVARLQCSNYLMRFPPYKDVEVQLRDRSFSGAEGTNVTVCVDAGPANRSFVVSLSTSPITALAGKFVQFIS